MWSSRPSVHAGVTLSWKQIVNELSSLIPAARCRRIRGPQGAVISSLLQAGWTPDSPTEWTAPSGQYAWQFKFDGLTGHSILDVPEPFFIEYRQS
eukprot:5611951-Pyramimonas_sp.AAC.1